MRLLELRPQDVELIEAELRTLCARSGAEAVVLLDLSGTVMAMHRVPEAIDSLMFGALLASNFAATEELSRRLGVTEFRVMYHEGKRQNLYFYKVGEEGVLVILFRDSNALGRVRLFCEKSIPELAKRVEEVVVRAPLSIVPAQARSAVGALRQLADTIRTPKGLG